MSSKSLSRSEIDGKLKKLDKKLDKLRRDYEQFFVGSRERPPRNERKQVKRLVRELEKAQITNTSQRFRLRSLVQRFSSYRQKWNRIQRQIEEGTYRPHQKRAERRSENGGDQQSGDAPEREREEEDEGHVVELEEMGDVDLSGLEEELEEMAEAGAFDEAEETERLSESELDEKQRRREKQRRSSSPEPPDEKKEKLREMQDKLGISSGGNSSAQGSESSGDSDAPRRRPDPPSSKDDSELPTGGAKREDLEKMRQSLDEHKGRRRNEEPRSERTDADQTGSERRNRGKRQRSSNERSGSRRRTSRESSDDDDSSSDDDDGSRAEQLFEKLVETKREYGESTDHLTLEAVEQSMARQRERIRAEYGIEEVVFDVVVKDEKVYLQPQLPD